MYLLTILHIHQLLGLKQTLTYHIIHRKVLLIMHFHRQIILYECQMCCSHRLRSYATLNKTELHIRTLLRFPTETPPSLEVF